MSRIKNTTEYWKNIEEEENNIMKNEKMEMVATENTVVEKEHESMENKIVSMGFVPETSKINPNIIGRVGNTEKYIEVLKITDGSDFARARVYTYLEYTDDDGNTQEKRNLLGEFKRLQLKKPKKLVEQLQIDEFEEKDVQLLAETILHDWTTLKVEVDNVALGSDALIEFMIRFIEKHKNDKQNLIKDKNINTNFKENDDWYYVNENFMKYKESEIRKETGYKLETVKKILADCNVLKIRYEKNGDTMKKRYTHKVSGMTARPEERINCFMIRKIRNSNIVSACEREVA